MLVSCHYLLFLVGVGLTIHQQMPKNVEPPIMALVLRDLHVEAAREAFLQSMDRFLPHHISTSLLLHPEILNESPAET